MEHKNIKNIKVAAMDFLMHTVGETKLNNFFKIEKSFDFILTSYINVYLTLVGSKSAYFHAVENANINKETLNKHGTVYMIDQSLDILATLILRQTTLS